VVLTFMMGIGSSPGAPRSSIMFLMSIERSATLRSVVGVSGSCTASESTGGALTGLDLDIVGADQLDLLLALGRHGDDIGCV